MVIRFETLESIYQSFSDLDINARHEFFAVPLLVLFLSMLHSAACLFYMSHIICFQMFSFFRHHFHPIENRTIWKSWCLMSFLNLLELLYPWWLVFRLLLSQQVKLPSTNHHCFFNFECCFAFRNVYIKWGIDIIFNVHHFKHFTAFAHNLQQNTIFLFVTLLY